MTNQQHIDNILRKLEADHGAETVYDYFSGFSDVVVLGHTSNTDDNPHEPTEQPSHTLYHLGATAAEILMAELHRK